ncbi:MAG: undecaprenyl-diphosphate phosphatase [Phycisphaeraceae bacterium]
MEWWQAIVLGIVEGLTEYLPVSSTGHLILAQRAMGIPESEAANAYAICIQAGAIAAVLGLYFARVKQMSRGLLGRDEDGLRLVRNVLAGFVPAAIAGLLLNDLIREYLFGGEQWGLWPTVLAWFLGGVAILIVAWNRKRDTGSARSGLGIDDLTLRMALIIGVAQCIAMWPGVSRSLVTIVGGVLVGLSLPAAVEFSFLLGLVTLSAATAHDGVQYGDQILGRYGTAEILLGFVFAWLAAVIAVKWMVAYLNRHGLGVFGYYRVALAVVVALLILADTFASARSAPPVTSATVPTVESPAPGR